MMPKMMGQAVRFAVYFSLQVALAGFSVGNICYSGALPPLNIIVSYYLQVLNTETMLLASM